MEESYLLQDEHNRGFLLNEGKGASKSGKRETLEA